MAEFTTEERRILLRIAREAIEAHLDGRRYDAEAEEIPEKLKRPAGAFVTLEIGGDLRGCIGSIVPTGPLHRTVAENAVNAAARDPRFPPLSRAEFDRVDLEISVLGPIEPVTNLESIVVGRDGLIVRKGRYAGLLLPQVPVEWGWNRDEFLSHTCLKAGLPADAWRSGGVSIEKFSAEVFGEHEL